MGYTIGLLARMRLFVVPDFSIPWRQTFQNMDGSIISGIAAEMRKLWGKCVWHIFFYLDVAFKRVFHSFLHRPGIKSHNPCLLALRGCQNLDLVHPRLWIKAEWLKWNNLIIVHNYFRRLHFPGWFSFQNQACTCMWCPPVLSGRFHSTRRFSGTLSLDPHPRRRGCCQELAQQWPPHGCC